MASRHDQSMILCTILLFTAINLLVESKFGVWCQTVKKNFGTKKKIFFDPPMENFFLFFLRIPFLNAAFQLENRIYGLRKPLVRCRNAKKKPRLTNSFWSKMTILGPAKLGEKYEITNFSFFERAITFCVPQNGEITEKTPFGRFRMMKRLKLGGEQDFSEIVQNGWNDILIEVFIGM